MNRERIRHPIKEKCIFAPDRRVLRKNKGDHTVFVILDDTAYDREVPERLEQGVAEHDPGRPCEKTEFIQKEDL